MSSYNTFPSNEANNKTSQSLLATVMLIVCIVSFVLQTELAQYVQKTTDYSKPYFILYISHSCYIFMIPLNWIVQYFMMKLSQPLGYRSRVSLTIETSTSSFKRSLAELQERLGNYHDSPRLFLIKTSLALSVLLTLPSYIWYLSVNLTSMSNLTAIYNTGCFFAYLFSIIMLHDRIVFSKFMAVVLCMLGVVVMACWPTTENNPSPSSSSNNNTEWIGILVSTIGASLYGFYEVFYKKYAAPSRPTIAFANTITGMIGIVTLLVLWIPFPLLHYFDIERFQLPDTTTFGYILAIASMSVVYNATFMAVIALVNPVFAAVGVMLTIPAVAFTDILVTGTWVPLSTIIGSTFILFGFIILNRQKM